MIGPLAADGYRVLCPDLRGAGHWLVEQRPDLVLDRLRAFLAA